MCSSLFNNLGLPIKSVKWPFEPPTPLYFHLDQILNILHGSLKWVTPQVLISFDPVETLELELPRWVTHHLGGGVGVGRSRKITHPFYLLCLFIKQPLLMFTKCCVLDVDLLMLYLARLMFVLVSTDEYYFKASSTNIEDLQELMDAY